MVNYTKIQLHNFEIYKRSNNFCCKCCKKNSEARQYNTIQYNNISFCANVK